MHIHMHMQRSPIAKDGGKVNLGEGRVKIVQELWQVFVFLGTSRYCLKTVSKAAVLDNVPTLGSGDIDIPPPVTRTVPQNVFLSVRVEIIEVVWQRLFGRAGPLKFYFDAPQIGIVPGRFRASEDLRVSEIKHRSP